MNKALLQYVMVLTLVPASAWAGFEWIPPAEQPSPVMNAPQELSAPNAMPAAPVVRESLSAPMQMAPRVLSAEKVSSKTMGGLYIDPYPLGANPPIADTTTPVVDQAMMEKSRMLNPVQLGGGMTTGVKPKKMASVTTGMSRAKGVSTIGTESLTPMMGGEPAPLPGYSRGGVDREPLRQYAQAIGFGKELPLALALSQVIPGEFTHRFEGNVDPSLTVSWEGGKPWNLVLADMLADQNLTANIEGNVVVIRQVSSV